MVGVGILIKIAVGCHVTIFKLVTPIYVDHHGDMSQRNGHFYLHTASLQWLENELCNTFREQFFCPAMFGLVVYSRSHKLRLGIH